MSKKNIFAKFQDYVNKPKRNVFDLSFANNITTKFGQLTPVFCKECIPGDSFKIHSRFALQMMPMKFPVQTPMRAYLHYFYVRNRTLYKDWMDFIGGTKDNLTLPYVQPTDKKKFYRVGGLADYLGVPNVLYSSETSSTIDEMPIDGAAMDIVVDDTNFVVRFNSFKTPSWVDWNFLPYAKHHDVEDWTAEEVVSIAQSLSNRVVGTTAFSAFSQLDPNRYPNPWNAIKTLNSDVVSETDLRVLPWAYVGRIENTANLGSNTAKIRYSSTYRALMYVPVISVVRDLDSNITSVTGQLITATNLNDGVNIESTVEIPVIGVDSSHTVEFYIQFAANHQTSNLEDETVRCSYQIMLKNDTSVTLEYGLPTSSLYSVIGDGDLTSTPYDSNIHLNALPFRAYEAIYNSYYRNAQNNPYILNNVAEYNKYIPSYDGGADTNEYDLHQRNWEYDFLTSAVQTPQQGDIAPLVGISVTGEATFQDENGNTYYASAQYDDNGNITGWTSHSPNMPQGSLRLLMDMAGTGISINDLRNVNAFQKFLENNIRRGLKYRDQIKSHFGVDVRYDELDMPEFIGGCSTDVSINKLSQTSESGNTPLGSFVGQASAYGESKHDITHYCDEHGFIIGILSIVPVPVYSQLLPKYFLKSEQLDYFFPEFGHIGYQPILQKEVSPLQTFYTANDLNKVFGYQRSWYDYLDSTDEVHGQFRTTMRDFLMNRTFEDEPELSKDFLLVDPDQLNDVFLAGTDDDDIYAPEADKIIGSLYFNVSKKSPIPLFGIPRLD